MPAVPPVSPPRRRRRGCAQGRHAADPATTHVDGHNCRAICRRCKRPIVRAVAVGSWLVSAYLE